VISLHCVCVEENAAQWTDEIEKRQSRDHQDGGKYLSSVFE
jgi:hypothetical protein